MQRWSDFEQAAAAVAVDGRGSVVTIGNFDGVHRGHRAVLAEIVAEARRRDTLAVAITFDPHPLTVLSPQRAPSPICTLQTRLDLLAETGLDGTAVITFTHELAKQSPEEFVTSAFVDALGAKVVVVGRDMRFGHRNSGDVNTLRELGEQYGFEVLLIDDLGGAESSGGADSSATHRLEGQERRWSSTWVREALAEGDVDTAAQVLGRWHRVSGTVVHGDHRGRELGFPTANLGADCADLVPADGVYAGWLVMLDGAPIEGELPGRRLPAAISIGTNPTFEGTERRVEAYVLDRTDLDLYGRRIAVDFVTRLRETVRFEGIEALVVQMNADVAQAREVLAAASDPSPTSSEDSASAQQLTR